MAVEQLTISDEQLLDKLGSAREDLLREIRKAIIGQDEVVEQVLLALFVGGHSIITGVPGLAKTLLVRTIASVLDLQFKRIQFTPDLMPADITGGSVYDQRTASFTFNAGQGEVCYDYSVSGVEPLTAAHIHVAPAGSPGPVVIATPATSATGGSGCVSADRDLIVAILTNPSAYYFNVHNAPFPAGALRGQLTR